MVRRKEEDEGTPVTPITEAPVRPAAKATALRDPPYCAATKDEQEALFARYGRDNVKALPGFRNMPLSAFAKAFKA